MRRIFPTLTIVLVLMTGTSGGQEITTTTSDCYTQPQIKSTVNGKPQEPGIDLLCADIPEEITNQVERLTGIIAKDDGVSMIVVDLGKGRWMHNVRHGLVHCKMSGFLEWKRRSKTTGEPSVPE